MAAIRHAWRFTRTRRVRAKGSRKRAEIRIAGLDGDRSDLLADHVLLDFTQLLIISKDDRD